MEPSPPAELSTSDLLPCSPQPKLDQPARTFAYNDLFDSDSDLTTPPSSPAPSASGSPPARDDQHPPTATRRRPAYARKKNPVGPAAIKTFLDEGLYYGLPAPSSPIVPLESKRALVQPERKRPRRSTFWDYETVLPDGSAVAGKLDLLVPIGSTGLPEGSSTSPSLTSKLDTLDDQHSIRPRLRARASLPASLPPTVSAPSSMSSSSQGTSEPSSSSISVETQPAALPPPPGLASGSRLRPRASLPASRPFPTPPVSVSSRRPKKADTLFQFPLPIEDGFRLLVGERDFDLPYDIRWENDNETLGRRRVPPKFKQLKKNIFPHRNRDMDPAGAAVCSCVAPKDPDEMGCGDKCINRMMQYLCHPKSCPCEDRCSNKSLYKRLGPKTKVFWTGNRGFGLKALEPIPSGAFVIDYRGEIIEISAYYTRILTTYASRSDFYALEYGEGEVIDACLKGNNARFVNHGCSPNLEVRKYTTLGEGVEEYEVGLWASRDIEAGEELFYDYNFDSFSNRPSKLPADASASTAVAVTQEGNGRQRCTCGADGCSGWIGGKKVEPAKPSPSPLTDLIGASKTGATARKRGKGKDAVAKKKRAPSGKSKRRR